MYFLLGLTRGWSLASSPVRIVRCGIPGDGCSDRDRDRDRSKGRERDKDRGRDKDKDRGRGAVRPVATPVKRPRVNGTRLPEYVSIL